MATSRASTTSQHNWKTALHQFRNFLFERRTRSEQYDDATRVDDFVPAGEIQQHLSKQGRLKEIVAAVFDDPNARPEARSIYEGYVVVFAILVVIDSARYIGTFLPNRTLSDAQLPFSARPPSFPRELWERFRQKQMRYCAPVLGERWYDFEETECLPFLEKVPVERKGTTADVYRVKIHASHDNFRKLNTQADPNEAHRCYALKAYRGRHGEKNCKIEMDAFKRFKDTGLRQFHIIGYHCSYQHKGHYFTLLEYANVDTLETFMESNSPPLSNADLVSFWEALTKVIEPICTIHNFEKDSDESTAPFKFTGLHQDIKPRNILATRPTGNARGYDVVFGLADLGTSQFKYTESQQSARDNRGTKTYGSPECFREDIFDDKSNIWITDKVDIWSFACVLSEACVYVVFGKHGEDGLDGYRARRLKYNKRNPRGGDWFHQEKEMSEVVAKEHRKLARQHKCDAITQQILELMPEMLESTPAKRISAVDLRKRLKVILEDAKADLVMTFTSPALTETSVASNPRSATTTSGSSRILGPRKNRSLSHGSHRKVQSYNGPYGSQGTILEADLAESPRPITTDGGSEPGSPLNINTDVTAQSQHSADSPDPERPKDRGNTVAGPSSKSSTDDVGDQNPDRSLQFEPRSDESPLSMPSNEESGSPAPLALQSPQRRPLEPARLSFADAVIWKREKKAGTLKTNLPNNNLLEELSRRDQVFVVDDSDTMNAIRLENRRNKEFDVSKYVGVLSYMVKAEDPDGMDLYYFNSTETVLRCKHSSTFENSISGRPFTGISNPNTHLKPILDDYTTKLRDYKLKLIDYENRQSRHFWEKWVPGPAPPRPLSVYVFTDGVWQSDKSSGGEYLENTIKALVEEVKAAGRGRDQVGIQFIRFGSNPYGIGRLEALDRLGRTAGLDMDIIDTSPVKDDNVWKMLLGAINPRFDADPDANI